MRAVCTELRGTDDELGTALIPFICGPYFKQERWLLRMSQALYFI